MKALNRHITVAADKSMRQPFGRISRPVGHVYCDDSSFEPYGVQEAKGERLDVAGLVVMKEIQPCGDWDIRITPAANSDFFDLEEEPPVGLIMLGHFHQYEITGIVEEGARATVELAIEYTPTPSGRAFIKAGGEFVDAYDKDCHYESKSDFFACPMKVSLIHFDDGWRYQENK